MTEHGYLTDRQVEVLALSADGWSAAEVGRLLGISYQTVKNHLSESYRVLGVTSAVEAYNVLGWVVPMTQRYPGHEGRTWHEGMRVTFTVLQ